MNLVVLVGNVGSDPEQFSTESGKNVYRFSLATNEYYKEKQFTEWHRITVWEKDAFMKHVKKGTSLVIQGKVKTSKYEKDGETRYSTEIVANRISFGPKNSSQEGSSEEVSGASAPIIEDDEDLPF